ncbi:class I SAM-dependent methyltransferase [Hellea balneolensis]|uniref:class I SAM-dependent methyltransferase n=1 Tax=Hellea balneolensis TaxID=287478 RepID=UPI0003FD5FD5|nr:class I SAM-dependent methyltransferase [Hellea balneolensis]
MGLYNKHVLPLVLDKACGIKPITKQREKVVPLAEGVVLEIGIGSGQNLPHYDASKVTKIIGIDPDEHIWKRSAARRKNSPINIERIGLSGEDIPLDNNQVDSVVVTYSLCTIPDPVRALKEMKRILKPGGRILFSEHGKAPDDAVNKWQNRIDPLWKKLAGGCHSGRDIPALFTQADLKFDDLQEMYIPGPKVLSYNYWGVARA